MRLTVAKSFTLCLVAGTLVSGTALGGELRKSPPGQQKNYVVKYVEPNGIDAAATIYTNLGPATNAYDVTVGAFYVAGPTNTLAVPPDPPIAEQWLAIPFTPKQNSHATTLQAAIGYISGTKRVRLGIYTDNAGVVGTRLAQGVVTTFPDAGVCCALATAHIAAPGVALTANTPYWLVAYSDDVNGPDLGAVWQPVNSLMGANVGQTGWQSFPYNGINGFGAGVPAGAVKGTVP